MGRRENYSSFSSLKLCSILYFDKNQSSFIGANISLENGGFIPLFFRIPFLEKSALKNLYFVFRIDWQEYLIFVLKNFAKLLIENDVCSICLKIIIFRYSFLISLKIFYI